MVTKLRNIPYSVAFKTLLLLVIAMATMVTLQSGYELAIKDDYAVRDYFYQTYEFENLYKDLIETSVRAVKADGTVDVNEQNSKLISDTFRYQITGENGQILATNLRANENADGIFNSRYAIHFSRTQAFAAPNGVLDSEVFTEVVYNTSDVVRSWLEDKDSMKVSIDYHHDQQRVGKLFKEFEAFKAVQDNYVYRIAMALAFALSAFIWLTITAGKKESYQEPSLIPLDFLPLELVLVLVPLAFMPAIAIISNEPFTLLNLDIFIWLTSFAVVVGMGFYLSVVRRIKSKYFWRSALTVKMILWLAELVRIRNWQAAFKPYMVITMLGYGAGNCIATLMVVTADNEMALLWFIFFLALNGYAVSFLLKHLTAIKSMMAYVNDQASGDMKTQLSSKDVTPCFVDFVADLNTLHQGLGVAVQEAVKGERLRTELITNVTHDLKTPLTSIITYVDLLSKEPTSSETVKGYISILTDKSNRLKALIEHLVEASKISSGVVEVAWEPLDLVAMLQQIQGEYQEAFENAALQLVFTNQLTEAPINSDPKMLYRILDNLMSNSLKYALPGTRVFMSLAKQLDPSTQKTHLNITLKNTSKHPLNIAPEELLERFVRGDSARHSEGNGLGLSIAMSLANALDADLKLSVDGDLFKVDLRFKA